MKIKIFITLLIGLLFYFIASCKKHTFYYLRDFCGTKPLIERIDLSSYEIADDPLDILTASNSLQYLNFFKYEVIDYQGSLTSPESLRKPHFFRFGKYITSAFQIKMKPCLNNLFENELLDENRFYKRDSSFYMLIMFDTIENQFHYSKNGIMSSAEDVSIMQTDSFFYINFIYNGNLSGGALSEGINYNTAVILIKKKNPTDFHRHIFENEYLHKIEQTSDGCIRIISSGLERHTSFFNVLLSIIGAPHIPAEFFNATGEFFEYKFDEDMNIISRIQITDPMDEEIKKIKLFMHNQL